MEEKKKSSHKDDKVKVKAKKELKKQALYDELPEEEVEEVALAENETGKKKKKVDKKRELLRKRLMYAGYVICAILLIVNIVTTVTITKLNLLPVKYVVLVEIVFLIFFAWMVILQRWLTPGIITKVIAVIMIIVMIVGCVYVDYTYKSIKKMTGVSEKVDQICVFVLTDNPAETIQDAADYTFGVLTIIDAENTASFKADIEETLGQEIATDNYDYVLDLIGALYSGEVDAIILNGAYSAFATSADEYKNFDDETRIIYSAEIISEVKTKEKNDAYLASEEDGEVFTLYISGIDTRGSSPRVNSNSDVNILMTVNTKTRQILLISTPRDFYVPLSISDGVKDKLTHAGGYGIDVSVDTMEMLYEVNIDDYVKINFTGFIDVIDALGGISVYSENSFYTTSGGYAIEVGYNECDGEKALAFARDRYHVPGGDRGRGKNQMEVITAVINKLASSQLLNNYTEILDSLTDSMVTSMSYDEISELVKFQLDDMRGWDIVKYSVNGYDSTGSTYSAGSQRLYVMEPDTATVEQAKEYLKQIYNNETVVIEEETTETEE